jgi:acetate kinase
VRVLVVNAGSSSLKHALVDAAAGAVVARGEERWDPDEHEPGRHAAALAAALTGARADAVGHRVVHGGIRFIGPTVVSAEVREAIAALAELAPLHTRAALEGIDAAGAALPGLPHVACFDTAFHRTLAPEAATYALPHEWTERFGLRRFGFHGLNVEWCAERAPGRRIVVCHLGSGCSVSAVRDGRSVDTTMGFTPLEGVPMATRSGSVDPGLLLHLLDGRIGRDEVEHALNHRSGLLGISGVAGGVREVGHAAAAGDDRASLAIAVFVRGVAGAVAAMTASIGGLETLVFTGGVGEGSARIRGMVAGRLAHLGVALDDDANRGGEGERDIGAAGAPVRVLIVPAGEELVIARQTRAAVMADP